MLISQTPFRVSFAGGGTDLSAFYREEFGAVLSASIKRHVYVTVHERFEPNIRVSYSKTEVANSVAEVRHSLVRESLRLTEIRGPLEVTTIADVPAGTGLGSSSSLTVGLLNALHAQAGRRLSRELLARQACDVEIARLAEPIGKQDQYAAAFGGLNYIRFNPDESVVVEPVACAPSTTAELERHVVVIYTQLQRAASEILGRQRASTQSKRVALRAMRDLAGELRSNLEGRFDAPAFGQCLHEAWQLKRDLVAGITSTALDTSYAAARAGGAWGGKLLGAGGGGFLMLFAPPERHAAILERLQQPRTLPFRVEPTGSRIVFSNP
ncbi:MAG TPA: sugar kinase [Polyangiaceae bacterium]|nr:sugar kinase [Polyangiaceae bacterium]